MFLIVKFNFILFMTRVKKGMAAHARHKKVIKKTKGFLGRRSSKFRAAKEALMKAGTYAYRDRKAKKRSFRRLWQIRINAAVRTENLTYNKFIDRLKKANIEIDRKILANLAVNNPEIFKEIVKVVKE